MEETHREATIACDLDAEGRAQSLAERVTTRRENLNGERSVRAIAWRDSQWRSYIVITEQVILAVTPMD